MFTDNKQLINRQQPMYTVLPVDYSPMTVFTVG